MHLLLIVVPAVFAGICFALPSARLRLTALQVGAAAHVGIVVWSWSPAFSSDPGPFFAMDPLAHLFITLTSALFLATSIHFLGYHRNALASQRIFLSCLLGLLSALSAVCLARHLGVLWVCMETASLAATPLIYSRLNARALVATWKFLLMNSVGIALALLGIFCIAIATLRVEPALSLDTSVLAAHARELDVAWLRAGFLLVLVGFGTKLGLSPLHSWKPDAYAEAPPPVAALLSGGVTLGAFIGVLRVYHVCAAAGLSDFAGGWLVAFGLMSIATAAVFIIGNNDYRRILAYTSVEHVGVMVIGIGLGAAGGPYASMLHAMHNTLNKGALFFVAGFFWRLYESNRVSDVRGALHQRPAAGILFLGGLCATCGLPPFGMFFSELGILFAAAERSQWWLAGLFVIALCAVFVGVMTALLPMVFGPPLDRSSSVGPAQGRWRTVAMLAPAALLLIAGFSLGAYQPVAVKNALTAAAESLRPSDSGLDAPLADVWNEARR